jgi:hypothetical protein
MKLERKWTVSVSRSLGACAWCGGAWEWSDQAV